MEASAVMSGLFYFKEDRSVIGGFAVLEFLYQMKRSQRQKNSGMFPSRPESSGANTLYTTAQIYATLQEIIYFL
ncbi:hypothetical protein EHQ52_03160 [Leptospira koniambonensis]|uniref:Uncharacterized protein n=1 Tax=Leptospira koniambonensis TaxID=2484950 RepID=A0A4R9JEE6_9LEPT|nr:hypothetical protein [Leptospira koniambonensis]TGL36885.1 hypothetical protein EHQ52_03160 [Leptospira koniambonensis]